jgi:hypothetical protein
VALPIAVEASSRCIGQAQRSRADPKIFTSSGKEFPDGAHNVAAPAAKPTDMMRLTP